MTMPSLELKRHCRELSTEETDKVIEAMADLVVSFVVENGKEPSERNNEQSEG
jgi:hypothetical protein